MYDLKVRITKGCYEGWLALVPSNFFNAGREVRAQILDGAGNIHALWHIDPRDAQIEQDRG